MKTLVIYHSRTGITKKVAETISKKIDADLEEIVDLKSRKGVLGWLSAGKDAAMNASTEIKQLKYSPENYDLVIIGTPIWAGTIAPAIRTYLTAAKIKKAALFCTCGSSPINKAYADVLSLLVSTKFVGKIRLTSKEIKQGPASKIDSFIAEISSKIE